MVREFMGLVVNRRCQAPEDGRACADKSVSGSVGLEWVLGGSN